MTLLKRYRQMADTGAAFRGLSVVQHTEAIGRLVRETSSETLLDYGSGAGDQYLEPYEIHKRWGVARPRLFDPSFSHTSAIPIGTFHGVICSDVLEHIPAVNVDWLIGRLFDLSERFVFASVCCRPARKTFEDGRNLHISLHPIDWWRGKFEWHARKAATSIWELVETP